MMASEIFPWDTCFSSYALLYGLWTMYSKYGHFGTEKSVLIYEMSLYPKLVERKCNHSFQKFTVEPAFADTSVKRTSVIRTPL